MEFPDDGYEACTNEKCIEFSALEFYHLDDVINYKFSSFRILWFKYIVIIMMG